MWMSLLITMMIYGIFGGLGGNFVEGGNGIIAGLLAIGYFVTGEVNEMKWVKYLGFGWWIGAIILFFSSNEIGLLVMAILMTLLQFIPGVILFVKGPKND